jgi:hypothetical protein
MAFVTARHSAKAKQPGEQPLDMPPTYVPAQRAAILRYRTASVPLVWRDHFDSALGEFGIEPVAVEGTVADQFLGDLRYESSVERRFNELCFMSLTACNPDRDRKARAVCHCHDLGRFAASSNPNLKTPLLAPAWVPSMNASVRSSFPRSSRSSASARRIRSRTPSLSHFWNRS